MCLLPLPHLYTYWEEHTRAGAIFGALKFGVRFGISRERFKCIERALQWDELVAVSVVERKLLQGHLFGILHL
jgi:hypothetical protein